MRNSLKEVLMNRDGLTEAEAKERIKNARIELNHVLETGSFYEADEFMKNQFGLEPDYLDDLLF